ncbi:helix-turn-helix transcriptional regulator, partial [Vibrio vulnificus]
MPDIRFTLFDSDNFYQQGLRLLLQDYLHSLNECQRLYPQFSPLALQALD